MLTFRNRVRRFQVKALVGLAPGERCVELSDHHLEDKRRMDLPGNCARGTSVHLGKGDPTLSVA
jgi:hypothetical protein